MKSAWRWCKEHIRLVSAIVGFMSTPVIVTQEKSMEFVENFMQETKNLIASGNLEKPLMVFAVVFGVMKFSAFVKKHHEWFLRQYKKITGEAKREREKARLQESREIWRGLINEMGFHVGLTKKFRGIHFRCFSG